MGIERERGCTYQTKVDCGGEPGILRIILDLGIREEERHREEGADDHRACHRVRGWYQVSIDSSPRLTSPTPKPAAPAHQTRHYRAGDAASVRDGIVTPLFVLAQTAELSASCTEVLRQEDVVEWVSESCFIGSRKSASVLFDHHGSGSEVVYLLTTMRTR